MATADGIIAEDTFYKLSGSKSRSKGLFSKGNPWKQKYFILRISGNRPVLEYYNKKPKNKNVAPKDKIFLARGFRLEKVTNTRNRAYVFELTTAEKYLCLSADEQRNMDLFVFAIQAQIKLREQIQTDYVEVRPENSESQRRIGAKGTKCILHICPWGITLSLSSCRAVLAQWPLKSVRYFEASGQGRFLLEAGRVAPMGDGTYIFDMLPGDDNKMYDLLDQYIIEALGKIQPNRRGNTEEMEDYVVEVEKLFALTEVSVFARSNPDFALIMKESWNIDIQPTATPRPTVHTRQENTSASFSNGPPPLPERSISTQDTPSTRRHFIASPSISSPGSLADRPPLPPPAQSPRANRTPQMPHKGHAHPSHSKNSDNNSSRQPQSSKPISFHRNHSEGDILNDQYLKMSGTPHNSGNMDAWSPPPSFNEAANYPSVMNAYLTPSHEEGGHTEKYLLPSPGHDSVFTSLPRDPRKKQKHKSKNLHAGRLRSVSCEDISNYSIGLGDIESQNSERQNSKGVDRNQNLNSYDIVKPPVPFPNLQEFHGSMEMLADTSKNPSNPAGYYNVEGLRGTVDVTPNPTVYEARKRFNTNFKDSKGRSISNPNFLQILNKDQLSDARASAIKSGQIDLGSQHDGGTLKHKSKSLLNLFRSKNNNRNSGSVSEPSQSLPSSPNNTLNRQSSQPLVVINGKGVYFTQRTRSFRKPKTTEGTQTATPPVPRRTFDQSNIVEGTPPLPKRQAYKKSPGPRRKSEGHVNVIRHNRDGSGGSWQSQEANSVSSVSNHFIKHGRQGSSSSQGKSSISEGAYVNSNCCNDPSNSGSHYMNETQQRNSHRGSTSSSLGASNPGQKDEETSSVTLIRARLTSSTSSSSKTETVC